MQTFCMPVHRPSVVGRCRQCLCKALMALLLRSDETNHTLHLCSLSAVFCLSLLNTHLLLIQIKWQYVKNLIKIKQDHFLALSREQSCTASSINRLDDRNISVVIQESSCIWWSGSMCFMRASPAPRLSCRVSMRPGCWTDTRCGRTLWCWQQRTAGPPSVHIRLNWPSLITLLWWQNDFFNCELIIYTMLWIMWLIYWLDRCIAFTLHCEKN